MISEKTLEDAKFYGKMIALVFIVDNLEPVKELDNVLDKFSDKITKIYVNASEYLQYAIRLTAGRYPAVTLISPEFKIISLIDRIDQTLENRIRESIDAFKFKGFKGVELSEFVPVPIDPDPSLFFNSINSLMMGYPVDLRGLEVFRTYCNVYKEYGRMIEKLNLDNDSSALIKGGKSIETIYTAQLSLQAYYGLRKIEEIIELSQEDGKVYRSKRKENRGLLVDQSYAGSAILNEYERTGNTEYLDKSLKIGDYILNNLKHEKGFMDVEGRDPLTSKVMLEPLANAEASIFFAKLYQVTGEQKYGEASKLAMASANGGAPHRIEVQERVMIAYLKLNEGIKSNDASFLGKDCRVELPKEKPQCKLQQDDKCYDDISMIQFKSF